MTQPVAFAVTWDYRCPFARNAHEHLLDAIEHGAPWEVSFVPFFLDQVHVAEGAPPAWEDPARQPNLDALAAGVVVRDRFPAQFTAVHRALFRARHDEGGDLRDREVVSAALERGGVDPKAVLAEVDDGWPGDVVRKEHERVVADLEVFGVPTFIVGDAAVFVRLMERPGGDGAKAQRTVERIIGLIGDHPELNEFKHTRVAR